jgi:ribosomal protein S12 methylthiotransferase accessory factor YcaO
VNVKKCLQHLTAHHNLEYFEYQNDQFKDFPSSVRVDADWLGERYSAWGVGQDQDLAFFKALIELIERFSIGTQSPLIYRKSGLFERSKNLQEISHDFGLPIRYLHPANSNGAACHLVKSKAKESAFCELLERHVVLSSLLLQIPPEKQAYSKLKMIEGYTISTYYWKVGAYYVVVAAATLPNGGILFGHSCSRNLKAATSKATEEVAINVIYSENTKDQKISISKIEPEVISSFYTYWRFSGNKRAFEFLESSNGKTKNWLRIPSLTNVFFAEVPIPVPLARFTGQLHCIRAISPQAQQLFFDNWKYEHINPLIFDRFSLPDFPHIIS